MNEPARGRLARQWEPAELGVHPVIGGGPMPAYVRRPHDELLRAMLDPAVADSRLVVVRGKSSTGKTRAAYEAVADLLPDWPLEYPRTAATLAQRLEAGIPARTVLWLGDLRHYADDRGGAAVLNGLDDLTDDEGYLVIATIWPEYWDSYIAVARAGPGAADPAGAAGHMLDRLDELALMGDPIDPRRSGFIDVPDRFTADELATAADLGDPVLAAAAAAAGQDGQVTQYLAGARDLLHRYDGPGGDPYGQAIITAAMDAARLGHADPLPAGLLLDAAAGYLTGPRRSGSVDSWREGALGWATDQLDSAVRALRPVSSASGTDGYQAAGYLDHHGRRARQDQLGPASLWDALVTYATGTGDLTRLAQAAADRGLYRHAAALWTAAAARGSTDGAGRLMAHLRQVNPADAARAGQWAAGRASLEDPWDLARLVEELLAAGADEALRTLLARDLAGRASIDHRWDAVRLLRALHAAGADEAVRTLAGRVVSRASPGNLSHIPSLLRALHAAGADEAVRTLAIPAVGQADMDDPEDVAVLLEALHAVGADDEANTLASRAAAEASLDDLFHIGRLVRALHEAGADDAIRALLARDPAGHAGVDHCWDVAWLLDELRAAGADYAVPAVLAGDPASHASLDYPDDVGLLIAALHAAGAADAARALATRAAAHVGLDDPWTMADGVAELLLVMQRTGADDAARALAIRATEVNDPWWLLWLMIVLSETGTVTGEALGVLASWAASHANLENTQIVTWLLDTLRAAGADETIQALLARDPVGQVSLVDPWDVAALLDSLRAAGAADAVRALAADAVRALAARAAVGASLDDAQAVARLLTALRAAGDADAVRALATRAVGQASLDDPQAVARLLGGLRAAGADDAVGALLARDPAGRVGLLPGHPPRLDHQRAVVMLLDSLRAAGADDAARTLGSRAADAGMFGLFLAAHPDQAPRYRFGREPDGTPSAAWTWPESTSQSRD